MVIKIKFFSYWKGRRVQHPWECTKNPEPWLGSGSVTVGWLGGSYNRNLGAVGADGEDAERVLFRESGNVVAAE